MKIFRELKKYQKEQITQKINETSFDYLKEKGIIIKNKNNLYSFSSIGLIHIHGFLIFIFPKYLNISDQEEEGNNIDKEVKNKFKNIINVIDLYNFQKKEKKYYHNTKKFLYKKNIIFSKTKNYSEQKKYIQILKNLSNSNLVKIFKKIEESIELDLWDLFRETKDNQLLNNITQMNLDESTNQEWKQINDEINNDGNAFFGITSTSKEFEKIWENACKFNYNDNSDTLIVYDDLKIAQNNIINKTKYSIKDKIEGSVTWCVDGKEIDKSKLIPDVINIDRDNNHLSIYDAKYYNFYDNFRNEEINISKFDVFKQYLYQWSYEKFTKANGYEFNKNAFVFPYDGDTLEKEENIVKITYQPISNNNKNISLIFLDANSLFLKYYEYRLNEILNAITK